MSLAQQVDKFLGSTRKIERLHLGERPSRQLAALLLQDFVPKDQMRDVVFGREYPQSWEPMLSAQRAEIQTKINTYAQIQNKFGKGWYIEVAQREALREILEPNGWDSGTIIHKEAPVTKFTEANNETYEIEDDIPMPMRGGDSKVIKSVVGIKVGQSFLVPRADYNQAQNIYAKISNWKKSRCPEWKFRYSETEQGLRVWRYK